MPFANTAASYGTVTKTFHWLTALLIFVVIPLGVIAHNMPYDTPEALVLKGRLYSAHKTVGLAIFFTALARIAWAVSQTKPGRLGDDHRAFGFLAQLVHWTLYTSLVLVPLMGWMTHAATEGFAPIWWPFGQDLPLISKDAQLAERFANLHQFFERVMIVSLLLHIAGALKHHLIDKDATLRRMWFGTTQAAGTKETHGVLPVLVAAVIFAVVGTIAALQPVEGHETGPALATVASDWERQDGEIAITVQQFGSPITGNFAEWTAQITFDETASSPVKGRAEIVINIGSLTLGTIGAQAMGPDFFDQTQFNTATVAGDLVAVDGGYELQGTLTIKGIEAPLNMPFDLNIEGDVATASGTLALDRTSFGVGVTQTDEATLGFGVDVAFTITAARE